MGRPEPTGQGGDNDDSHGREIGPASWSAWPATRGSLVRQRRDIERRARVRRAL